MPSNAVAELGCKLKQTIQEHSGSSWWGFFNKHISGKQQQNVKNNNFNKGKVKKQVGLSLDFIDAPHDHKMSQQRRTDALNILFIVHDRSPREQ